MMRVAILVARYAIGAAQLSIAVFYIWALLITPMVHYSGAWFWPVVWVGLGIVQAGLFGAKRGMTEGEGTLATVMALRYFWRPPRGTSGGRGRGGSRS